MATEQRPVPVPQAGQPAQQGGGQQQPRRPVPRGAAKWSRTFIGLDGKPARAEYEVPVDANDCRTPHLRYGGCKGKVEITKQRPGQPTTSAVKPCDVEAWLLPDDPPRFCPDHGCQLVPVDRPERAPLLPWPAIAKAVEPAARPLWVLLSETAAGVAVYAGQVPWWAPLAATPVLAGAAYGAVRWHQTRRALSQGDIVKGERTGRHVRRIRRRARTAAYQGGAAGMWLVLAAAADPTTVVGAVVWPATLLPAWAVASATWWRYLAGFRDRPVPAEPAPGSPPDPRSTSPDGTADPDETEVCRRWVDEMGAPNTRLQGWQRTRFGWRAVAVATKRGALNGLGGDGMKATLKRIASVYEVPRAAVSWIEEFEDNPNQALLLVQPHNPLRQGQVWPGPDSIDVDRGTAEVGRLIDGRPMMETLFRYGWGAPSAAAIGTTGSGKSMRVRKKLLIERWSSFVDPTTGQRRGLFLSFLHDPKRLESYAEFRDAVHGYGISRDDAHIMVDAFLREMFRRYDMLASAEWEDRKGRPRRGGVPWDWRVHGPVISCYWDEFHLLAGDGEFVKKLEQLARFQRACGMRGELLSHMATLGDTGSQALRDMLAGGRSTLFRTTSALTAGLLTGGQLTGDPRTLPNEPGMCFVADGETATLLGRESFVPADDSMHDVTLYDWLFDDDNRPVGFPAPIPPETAEAFGPEFLEWMKAGRSERGRVAPGLEVGGSAPVGDDVHSAAEALQQILSQVDRPLQRKEIATHPLWRFNVTSTLTAVLKRGQEAKPPWLVRLPRGNGVYELAPWLREQLRAARDEERDRAA